MYKRVNLEDAEDNDVGASEDVPDPSQWTIKRRFAASSVLALALILATADGLVFNHRIKTGNVVARLRTRRSTTPSLQA